MVYLIFDTKTKNTKIGKSDNPEQRLGVLKIGNPNVKLIYYTDKVEEKYLHEKYKALRVGGEWFKLKVEHLKDIMGNSKNIPKTLFYRSTITQLSNNAPVINIKQKTTIDIYAFKHTHDLYADMSGRFFRYKDDRPLPTCYHNGRIAVRDGVKRYGIKRLRLNAIKTTKKIDVCPF